MSVPSRVATVFARRFPFSPTSAFVLVLLLLYYTLIKPIKANERAPILVLDPPPPLVSSNKILGGAKTLEEDEGEEEEEEGEIGGEKLR